ncbi:MAG: GGDEF domain-containing protein [Alcanivoracaceae bacterium]|nr:GGDEF domain-containing protein [Alcanivoracaceae bacterium]
MKIFKALLPLLILTVLAMYARENFSLLPTSLSNALQYLPMLLIIFVSAITLHFNQGRVFSYVLILSSIYLFLEYGWFDSEFKFTLMTTFMPVLLLLVMLLREQGVFSIRALPVYLLFLFTLLFSLWLLREQPDWATKYLYMNWLPVRYFDWTQIPQTALGGFCLVFLSLIMLLSLRQDNQSATALGLLIISFIALQLKAQDIDLILLISTSLLLCLLVVLQESWRMAYLDELTQLPGRRALREKLQSLVGLYSIAMVDVDFFKKFNDQYGHDTGDEVLRMIAAKLKKVTGGGIAYRYGGEEFTLVFANKSTEQVTEHLEQMREIIATTAFVVNRRIKPKFNKEVKNKTAAITVSIGVADSIDITSTDETLKQADLALYKAKKKGRNCLSFS